jgi:excisionase family DNA binding protein
MNELLTLPEVAHILRVDASTVRRWVKVGALEAVILPHAGKRQTFRILRETVHKILGDDTRGQSVPKQPEDIAIG